MIEPQLFLGLSGLCVVLSICACFSAVFGDIALYPLGVDKDDWRAQSMAASLLSCFHLCLVLPTGIQVRVLR